MTDAAERFASFLCDSAEPWLSAAEVEKERQFFAQRFREEQHPEGVARRALQRMTHAIDDEERTRILVQEIKAGRHGGSVLCDRCQGLGERAYANTTTWRGGIGGQAITAGVCDGCWGSGWSDAPGPDLRQG